MVRVRGTLSRGSNGKTASGAAGPLLSPTRAPVQKMTSLTMAPKPRLNFLSAARMPRFPPFPERFGRWAVIAGASEGLGAAFAEALAARGLNLVLLARRQALLDTLAADLRAKHRVEVRAVACDLSDVSFAEALSETCAELDVGVAVYNAAFSLVAPLLDRPREEALRVVDVNVRGPVLFSHAVLPAMVARGRGALVLMSSLAGFQGTPKLAAYAASKAFNTVFAESLWAELRPKGVDVLASCAGAIRTPGFAKALKKDAPGTLDAAEVVARTLDAIGRGPIVIPGWINVLANFFLRRLVTRRTAVNIMERSMAGLQ